MTTGAGDRWQYLFVPWSQTGGKRHQKCAVQETVPGKEMEKGLTQKCSSGG